MLSCWGDIVSRAKKLIFCLVHTLQHVIALSMLTLLTIVYKSISDEDQSAANLLRLADLALCA